MWRRTSVDENVNEIRELVIKTALVNRVGVRACVRVYMNAFVRALMRLCVRLFVLPPVMLVDQFGYDVTSYLTATPSSICKPLSNCFISLMRAISMTSLNRL